ncbi:sigma-70 family RNA polymerase sigma factor [Paenibacillus sp. 481]|uniref:sigma-70 family RNA polymerase sigma factor n=1 Tax=Paenibacillus sp. 481 TaxID=2835869 RepID=UPI001E298508|nr:sigma-70 family RNA polymerase sigma factor [Paenibacillus sp. 481]UHA73236.1 sigma-70 family RNA polymerase sigma factor [Paenibacillus sp. 481]
MNQNDRVRAAQAGNRAAFLALIEAQQDRMYRIAYYYVRQKIDAEDVVHEAIYKALSGLPKLKQPQYFTTWLTRIVINCALTALHKRQRLVLDDCRAAELQQASMPRTDDRLDLLEAVRQLDTNQRQVIAFKYWHDMTIEEIARLLRMPSGTIKTILHRGLKSLRQHYANAEKSTRSEQNVLCEATDVSEQERLQQKLAELKQRSEELFDIPQSYELTIEDYHEDKREGGRAVLVWTKVGEDPLWDKPGKDTSISVELSDQGDLLKYTIDVEEAAGDLPELSINELRMEAETFIRDHYPTALKHFDLTRIKTSGSMTTFCYEQVVMELPLPLSGVRVAVHRSGLVSHFIYFGRQTKPKTPEALVAKELLMQHIASTVRLNLQLAYVNKEVCDVENNELRIVYEPDNLWMKFRADDKEEAISRDDEAEEAAEQAVWLSLPILPEEAAIRTIRTVEDVLEVLVNDPEQYALLREVDMDGQISGVVWRRGDWSSENAQNPKNPKNPKDRSLDAFLRERSQDTVKAKIDLASRSLVSFMRFEDRLSGGIRLSRDECQDIALRLLVRARPRLIPYLQLRQQEEAKDSDIEQFEFRIGKQNVWLGMDHIRIFVNKTTGRLERMDGPFIDPAQLEAVQSTTLVDERKACQVYSDALDLKLEWQIDYSRRSKKRRYRLMYRQVHRDRQMEIRFVDAHTGKLICSRNH